MLGCFRINSNHKFMDHNKPHLSVPAQIIRGGAEYLFDHVRCDEDKIQHNGRRAYLWPMCRWLFEITGEEQWKEKALKSAKEVLPYLKKDPKGSMIIYPGLYTQRNFSTNAIDCGIFLDSVHDLFALCSKELKRYHPLIDEMAHTYNAEKINGPFYIQNQILWCGTGLARWMSKNPGDAKQEEYKKQLLASLHKWAAGVEPDGCSFYTTNKKYPAQLGPTTYYHSRCIAFVLYILEKIGEDDPFIQDAVNRSSKFLLRMYTPSGTKRITLSTKRYYFWGLSENGSNPYDIYVFWKMFEKTGASVWQSAAGQALRLLYASQCKEGNIHSNNSKQNTDWQCDTMRTSHVAWLTKIPSEFLNSLETKRKIPFILPKKMLEIGQQDSLFLIGNQYKWCHFLVKKTPLCGWSGQRATGLLCDDKKTLNDLRQRMPLSYCYSNGWTGFKCLRPRLVWKSFKHSYLHAKHCLFYKNKPHQAWLFLRDNLLGFTYLMMSQRRTEWTCLLKGLKTSENEVKHDLILADVFGENTSLIGKRSMRWSNERLHVEDTIQKPGNYRISLGPFCMEGANEGNNNRLLSIKGPGRYCYSAEWMKLVSEK